MLHVLHRFKPLRFLLSLDLLFIALHILLIVLFTEDLSAFYNRFTVDRERGFAELYQYLKFSLIAGLLFYLFRKQRAWTYALWASIFTLALLDDALGLHERGGRFLVSRFDIPHALGLRGQDFGELITWSALGVAVLLALWISYRRATPKLRHLSRRLAWRFALLGVFGLGLDVVHSLFRASPVALQEGFAVLEDGGEMVVASLIAAFVWRLAAERQGRRGEYSDEYSEPTRRFEQASPQRAHVPNQHP